MICPNNAPYSMRIALRRLFDRFRPRRGYGGERAKNRPVAVRRRCNAARTRRVGKLRLLKYGLIALIPLVCLVCFFSYADDKVFPVLDELAMSALDGEVVTRTNDVVAEYITKYNLKYSDIITASGDESGKIKSLSVNYAEFNMFKSDLTIKLQESMNELTSVYAELPLGSLLPLDMFSGYGIPIRAKVVTTDSVLLDFEDKFESAGINQTRHLIYLRITVPIIVAFSHYMDKADIITEVPIAETVIVGDVPEAYVNFADKTGAAEE